MLLSWARRSKGLVCLRGHVSAALLHQLDAKCERQFAELKAALLRQHQRRKEHGTDRESGSARAEHSQAHEIDSDPSQSESESDGERVPPQWRN